MSGDDFDYVELKGASIQERQVKIDDIIADRNIRLFKPRSRKCMFIDEHQPGGYYDVRTFPSNFFASLFNYVVAKNFSCTRQTSVK